MDASLLQTVRGCIRLKKVCRGAERSLWGLVREDRRFGTSGVAVPGGCRPRQQALKNQCQAQADRDDGRDGICEWKKQGMDLACH